MLETIAQDHAGLPKSFFYWLCCVFNSSRDTLKIKWVKLFLVSREVRKVSPVFTPGQGAADEGTGAGPEKKKNRLLPVVFTSSQVE